MFLLEEITYSRSIFKRCSISFTVKECKAKVDIAFIVDSSGSISRRNWVRMKTFLKAITNEFDIAPEWAHVAIVAYSTRPEVVLRFNDLKGSKLNREEVSKKIDGMPHQRGFTFIDKALQFSDKMVFTTFAGMRKEVPQVFYF